jgi:hypothetical protein
MAFKKADYFLDHHFPLFRGHGDDIGLRRVQYQVLRQRFLMQFIP